MGLGIEVVENRHVDPTGEEVVDDMGTDESGSAGDKNAHGATVSIRRNALPPLGYWSSPVILSRNW